jgi:lipid II:glycine glycyltransferase (peptidoglycan interpeptide bridge formation enzyme)
MSATFDKGEACALFVREGERLLLLPLVKRQIPNADDTRWDATSPYGYPGPLVAGATDADARTFAVEALLAAGEPLRERGCVSLFVRLHPILGPTMELPVSDSVRIVGHGETVVLDLTVSEQDLWSGTMSGHRNEINRSLRDGHVARMDVELQHLDRFVEIYQATMSRVGASAYYFFDRNYVVALREALGASLSLCVVDIGGVIAAAGLFVETCGIVQYHLSGTDPAYMKQRPTKLMLHHVRSWAKARGNTVMHLGGGVGGAQDSLFKFKAGFSHGRASFHTLRMVIDRPTYQGLVTARDERHRAKTGEETIHADDALAGFFPAYRRP